MSGVECPPIFVVTYHDDEWETMEHLLVEDATAREVLYHVASWVSYQEALFLKSPVDGHPLKGCTGLIIGGPNG